MRRLTITLNNVKYLHHILFAPAYAIENREERRRIQMLITLMALNFIFVSLEWLRFWLLGRPLILPLIHFMFCAAVMVFTYKHWHKAAIRILMTGLAASNVVSILSSNLTTLLYSIMAFVAVSFLLERRMRLSYTLGMICIVLCFGFLTATNPYQWAVTRGDIFIFVVLAMLTVLMATTIIDGDLEQIRGQLQSLKQSEFRYRQMFDGNLVVQLVLDPATGSIRAANPAAARFYGYPLDRLVSMHLRDINEDADTILLNMKDLPQAPHPCCEAQHRLASGQIRDVEIFSTPMETPEGLVMYCVVIDVTHKRRAELRYHSLFEQSNDAVFILDLQTHQFHTNRQAAKMLGYTTDEMAGLGYPELVVIDDPEQEKIRKQRLTAGETIAPYECKLRRKDGNLLLAEMSIEIVRGKDGETLQLQSVARDITERKRIEHINQSFLEDMKALQDIHLELSEIDDLDALYYRMIEVSHQRMGMERIALFRIDPTQKYLMGTYGTDPSGAIRDERMYREDILPDHWTYEVLNAPNHMKIWTDADIRDENCVVGRGTKFAAALWNGRRSIGYIVCDNLMTGKPPRFYEGELASVLGSTFGHLIERKEMDVALKRSNDQLAEAQHIAQIGSWRWDMKTKMITWSDEIYTILGADAEAFHGTHTEYIDLIHPADRHYVKDVIWASYECHNSYSLYHRILHPRRGERIIHARGRVVVDEAGEVRYMIGTAQDVTDLKRTEDALSIRNKYLTTLHQVTLHLLNRRDIDDLLRTLLADATAILDAPYGEIMLKDGDALVVSAFTDNLTFLKGDRAERDEALLSWQAHDTGHPAVVEDYTALTSHRGIYTDLNLRAVADFPITIGDTCIGILGLARNEEGYSFTDEQIHIGQMLSQLAALVVDNVHQYNEALRDIDERKKTEERLHALTQTLATKSQIEYEQRVFAETLRNTATVISGTLDLNETLRLILENIQCIISHDASNIMLIENGVARVVQHYGWSSEKEALMEGVEFAVEQIPHLNLMYQTHHSCMISDVATIDGWLEIAENCNPVSYLAAPICVGDDVVGFLNLDSNTQDYFTPDHAHRLQAFVSHAAVALKNAQLYHQSQAIAALEERQRLARDLHDSVTQTLFAASVTANAIAKQWQQDSTSVGDDLLELRDLTRGALAEMRTMLLELRPNALIESNLNDLLPQLVETVKGRARLNVQFETDGICVIPSLVQVALFRIAQEALNNVIKHARAVHLVMRLHCDDDGIELLIQDDGRGFDPSHKSHQRFGLQIMSERACEAGISLEISTRIGHGTTLKAFWLKKGHK